MTTHDAVLALVTDDGGASLPAAPRLDVDDALPARRPAARGGALSGEELITLALTEGAVDDWSEDHLGRLDRREALLHRLAVDRQRRRRRIA